MEPTVIVQKRLEGHTAVRTEWSEEDSVYQIMAIVGKPRKSYEMAEVDARVYAQKNSIDFRSQE